MRGRFLLSVLGAFFPPHCVACEAPLPAHEPQGFCPDCFGRFPFWDTSRVLPPAPCPAYASFSAAGLYDGPLKEAILAMKFHDRPTFAKPLARLLVPLMPPGAAYVVPVPAHAASLRARRYNQSALLACEAARLAGIPSSVSLLERVLPGPSQHSQTRVQRLKLTSSAFIASPKVAGQHVVLVDDIFTTGATAKACSLALKKAGAARVDVLTLAYTPPAHEAAPNPLAFPPDLGY